MPTRQVNRGRWFQVQLSRTIVTFTICLFTAFTLSAQDISNLGERPGGPGRGRPAGTGNSNKFIVTFSPNTTVQERVAAARGVGAAIRHNLSTWNMLAIEVPNLNAVGALANNLSVLSIVPDRAVSTGAKGGNPGKPPKDGDGGGSGGGGVPIYGGTQQLVTPEVQRVGPPTDASDGTGQGWALLDTGVDYNHTDLDDNIAPESFSAFGGSCQDDRGHGTAVAGLGSAENNNHDIVGVAPGATIYCVKVLMSDGTGDESDVLAGLQWVADNANTVSPPIEAVNMSLGRELLEGEACDSTPILAGVQTLYNMGIPVVVSAGNLPDKEVTDFTPACYQEVFAIAGTVTIGGHSQCPESLFGAIPVVPADAAASFTTDGEFSAGRGVTISAPAEAWSDTFWNGSFSCYFFFYGVRSTSLGGGATRKMRAPEGDFELRGTSFAAPLVTGTVLRVKQLGLVTASDDSTEVEEIRTWIRDNADRKPTSPGDSNAAPLDHPWTPFGIVYTYDQEREGMVQAPPGP